MTCGGGADVGGHSVLGVVDIVRFFLFFFLLQRFVG